MARLRQSCPGIAISTDLIVGFPGETEADFAQTLDLMREAAFEQAFSFKYSPRPQTRAAGFPDQVPEEVKAERLARLQALQDELTLAAHARLVGQVTGSAGGGFEQALHRSSSAAASAPTRWSILPDLGNCWAA